jgi:tetratricopeptide (TPR) repeat protein
VRKTRDLPPMPTPDDYLRLAQHAKSPAASGELARRGLVLIREGAATDPEGALLLWREVFRDHLAAGRPRSALAVARKMVRLNVLTELAHADYGRTCCALGRWIAAAQSFRLAARFAPAQRRSLHWGACAAAFEHAGMGDEALAALDKALRWSTARRPLYRAHAAAVRLDAGQSVDDLAAIVSDLELAPCGEGYGRYVLGRLFEHMNDPARARKFLREFVRRNAADPMKAASLAGELARARKSLRSLRVSR